MACGSGRTFVALVCAVALTAVAAPAALSSSSSQRAPLASLESGVLQQLNSTRAQYGLVALRANAALTAAAVQHSQEMAASGYFDHDSADGTSFATRIAHWYSRSGFSRWSVGENLLWSSPTIGAASAVALWMHSPGHRANILDPQWREVGIAAVHVSSAGGAYRRLPVTILTTDFGVRR